MLNQDLVKIAEQIHIEWDNALENNDIERLLKLYSVDAIVESPLIPHLLNQDSGICHGHGELRALLEIVAKRKPIIRKYHKNKHFTDGKTIIWEYPRLTPDGEQMDFVEVMEIRAGLIQHHRVYWGWFGFNIIKENQYSR